MNHIVGDADTLFAFVHAWAKATSEAEQATPQCLHDGLEVPPGKMTVEGSQIGLINSAKPVLQRQHTPPHSPQRCMRRKFSNGELPISPTRRRASHANRRDSATVYPPRPHTIDRSPSASSLNDRPDFETVQLKVHKSQICIFKQEAKQYALEHAMTQTWVSTADILHAIGLVIFREVHDKGTDDAHDFVTGIAINLRKQLDILGIEDGGVVGNAVYSAYVDPIHEQSPSVAAVCEGALRVREKILEERSKLPQRLERARASHVPQDNIGAVGSEQGKLFRMSSWRWDPYTIHFHNKAQINARGSRCGQVVAFAGSTLYAPDHWQEDATNIRAYLMPPAFITEQDSEVVQMLVPKDCTMRCRVVFTHLADDLMDLPGAGTLL